MDWEEFRAWYQAKNPDSVMRAVILEKQKEENKFTLLKNFFDKMDKGKTGALDRAEFRGLCKAISLDANPKQLDVYFKQIDYDKNGTIEFEEFKEWFVTTDDDVLLKARLVLKLGKDKKTIQKAVTLRSIFNQIDSSQAGEVSMQDMLQVAVDLGVEGANQAELKLIFQEMDLDGNGTIDFDEFNEWVNLKGGKGQKLRSRIQNWARSMQGSMSEDGENSVSFGRGRMLSGTKRIEGKVTYYFSRNSGPYSLLKAFAKDKLTSRERTGFSTIDKIVYLQQTMLFSGMDIDQLLRVAQVAEQINLEAGEPLFEDGETGHAAYFIMRGVMFLHILGLEIPVASTTAPFGEISLLGPTPRAGKMTAAEDAVLLCLFRDDLLELFRKKLVDENKFMHLLGGLVLEKLRDNYAQLDAASSSGTVGMDLNLEIARAGWGYDTADFIYVGGSKKNKPRAAGKARTKGLADFTDEKVKGGKLEATVLGGSAYSTVEKVILLKSCKIFESASNLSLNVVAEIVKMIKVPAKVQLYREGESGYDAFVIASGQVRLTRSGQLVGMRGRGDVNGATSLISAGDPRSATVMTSTECLLMCISYDDFDMVHGQILTLVIHSGQIRA
jgi:CRP-like cAMP-binding protein/Ca2+-binding EF-hand superfamily protein